jgi:membrane protein YqaA with SNARE-associated domain
MVSDLTLWGSFASAFVSATLFPGGSEVMLFLVAREQQYAPWLLLAIVTLGNTLGALTTWLLGWLLVKRYPLDRPRKPAQQRAVTWLRRWGSPLLLLSWLPLVGAHCASRPAGFACRSPCPGHTSPPARRHASGGNVRRVRAVAHRHSQFSIHNSTLP